MIIKNNNWYNVVPATRTNVLLIRACGHFPLNLGTMQGSFLSFRNVANETLELFTIKLFTIKFLIIHNYSQLNQNQYAPGLFTIKGISCSALMKGNFLHCVESLLHFHYLLDLIWHDQGLLYHRTCKHDFLCSWPSLNSYLK